MTNPLPKRRKPTVDEILSDIKSYQIIQRRSFLYIFKAVVEALGYNVYHVLSTVKGIPDNHILTTIACVEGVKHLVENRCSYPTLQPIPLDFKDESPIYENSFIKFKLVWVSEDVIERRQVFLTPDSTWRTFYDFSIYKAETAVRV